MDKIVIFDWGGVVENHEENMKELNDAKIRLIKRYNSVITDEEILKRWTDKTLNGLCIGALNEENLIYSWVEHLERNMKINVPFLEFKNAYLEEFSKVSFYKKVVEYAHSLKGRCKIAILSNLTPFDKPRIDFQYHLSKFDYVYLSFEIGLRKPSKEIYEYVLKDCKLLPQNILFIDDDEKNINSANECGWNTCQAFGYEFDKIKKKLKDFYKMKRRKNNMDKKYIEEWLNKLKNYWYDKDIESAVSLFKNTTFYQETPFMNPYTTLEEIREEWQHIKNENIQNIEIRLLAIDGYIVIVQWILKQNDINFDGIYEIKFNESQECIYFKSWEMNDEHLIPNSVLEYGFDFDWDEKDVWKLDYPIEEISIEILEWHFNIPFWNWNDKWYVLKPIDVINNPKKYKAQYDRIIKSDISYPIDVMPNKERLVILDGLHRLVKYKLLGINKVKVRIIPRSEIKNIAKNI